MAISAALLEQIEKHPRFIASDTVLLYHSLGDEVQTHAFVEKWSASKKVLLPVVQGDILVLRHYTGKECLQIGAFGIEEPGGEDFTGYDEMGYLSKRILYAELMGKYSNLILTDENGKIIAVSEGYGTKAACENGIDSVKTNAPEAETVEE